MAKYMTKQRKALLGFLRKHADEAICAKEIAKALEKDGISVSAVYRNLSELEKEGLVKRVSKSESREAFFKYTDAPECRGCLHLSCKKCGKTYHMDDDETQLLVKEIAKSESFSLDKTETVLYGICAKCLKA